METEGLQKIELAVAGSRGGESVWPLEGSHITFPNVLHPTPPKNATMLPPPPYPIHPPGVQRSQTKSLCCCGWGVELVLETPSSAVSHTLEVAIPIHMAPLHLKLGASKGCTNAGLRGVVRAINLTCCHLYTHMQRPFGGEVGMSLLCQDLPEL